jgi:hypothetical protein
MQLRQAPRACQRLTPVPHVVTSKEMMRSMQTMMTWFAVMTSFARQSTWQTAAAVMTVKTTAEIFT